MSERTVKLYHPTGPDRVAVVSCEPSSQDPSQMLVRVARGKSAKKLVGGDVYGPYAEPELTARFDQAVQQLMSLGFGESFASDLSILKDKHSILRAREAARLGRQKNKAAVPALIEALGDAVDDSCTIIDALGEIGVQVVQLAGDEQFPWPRSNGTKHAALLVEEPIVGCFRVGRGQQGQAVLCGARELLRGHHAASDQE